MSTSLRRCIGLVAGIAALLGISAAALAGAPIKGATYTGTIDNPNSSAITFKVSGNGKTVKKVTIPTLAYCEGGGFGTPEVGSAKIKNGAFSAKLSIIFTGGGGHQNQGRSVVNGKFKGGGKAKGTIVTDYTLGNDCDGESSFTAVVEN